MHQRTVIRQAIVAALSGVTAAEDRVYATRVLPLRKLELPAIAVYTLEESVEEESASTAPRELTRLMPVVIECLVAVVPGANVDDAMDELALEVETAMHRDPYLGETVGDSILGGTSLEVLEDGDRMMGLVTLTYTVTYRNLAPEAPSNVAEYLRTRAVEDLGGEVHPAAQAVDEFDMRPEENP